MDEMSQTVDEAKLCKVVNEMLRQQYTSRDEHQYHIDQMQNFLKSDTVWESKKEIIVTPYQSKPTPVVQSCQRDPKSPALSLVNQDLLYLKKGNTGPENIALSLHKFLAVRFPDNDIEERTSKWALFDEDEEEFGELSLEAMEDEEVALVDGVFKGAFSVLGDESWCFGDRVLLSS
ncbi:hypothetical protein Tco_0907480 [Tanacetum coccineum]|uniref:Uncharacterized protein n=1 Tax=Tanacetum coccineum TaxID=301880 RepID=A0ABQ5CKJ5_9ASTR